MGLWARSSRLHSAGMLSWLFVAALIDQTEIDADPILSRRLLRLPQKFPEKRLGTHLGIKHRVDVGINRQSRGAGCVV